MPKMKEMGLITENVNACQYIAQAQLAERMGFSSFWVPEDYAFPAAFSTLGAIAAATTTIKLGTGVVNPYTRHPVLLAMEFAALDQVSKGRAMVGLGGGVKLWIEAQMGIPFAKPLAALRETVDIMRRLFAGETLEHDGRLFKVGHGMRFALEPERTQIPIYLGATGAKAQALAGEIADGVMPFMIAPDYIRDMFKQVLVGATKSGRSLRDFGMSAMIFLAVDEDDEAARENIKPLIATFLGAFAHQPDLPLFDEYGLSPADVKTLRESYARGELHLEMVSEMMIDGWSLAGSPERCREGLATLINAGITEPVFAPFVMPPGVEFSQHMAWLQHHLWRDFI